MSDKQHPAELLADRVMNPGFSADELADEIAEQLRRIPYLEAERDSWQQQASDRLDDALRFAAESDALRAEVERALDALRVAVVALAGAAEERSEFRKPYQIVSDAIAARSQP